MLVALKKAKQGIKSGQLPFGACVVKGNRIISVAHNEIMKQHDITAHAEVQAIRSACKKLKTLDLSACTLYTTCEPCPLCFSVCHIAKIPKIIYGVSCSSTRKFGYKELLIPTKILKKVFGTKINIKSCFLENKCLQLFQV